MKNRLPLIGAVLLLVISIYAQMRNWIDMPERIPLWLINLNLYGFVIALAIIVGIEFLNAYKPKELKKVDLYDALIWAAPPAVILARFWHVVTDFHLYEDNLLGVFEIWNGGLSIFGAVIGGVLGFLIYLKSNKIKPMLPLNYVFLAIPLVHPIGRLGNLLNEELFGPPLNTFWGMYVSLENRPSKYAASEYFHPAFLYESIGNLILFAILWQVWKKADKKLLADKLVIVAGYLVGYGLIRFVVDFARLDPDYLGPLSVGQIASLFMILSGSVYLAYVKLSNSHGKS